MNRWIEFVQSPKRDLITINRNRVLSFEPCDPTNEKRRNAELILKEALCGWLPKK